MAMARVRVRVRAMAMARIRARDRVKHLQVVGVEPHLCNGLVGDLAGPHIVFVGLARDAVPALEAVATARVGDARVVDEGDVGEDVGARA